MARGKTRHLCRGENGRPLRGARTGPPKGHVPGCRAGVWMYGVRVPTTGDPLHYLRRSGFDSRKEAEAELARVIALLDLVGEKDPRRSKIGDAIIRGDRPEEVRRKVGQRVDLTLPTPTVGRYLDSWLAAKDDVRTGTRGALRHRIDHFLRPHLGDLRLDELDEVHVREMFDWIRERNAVVKAALDAHRKPPPDPLDTRRRQAVVGLPMQHHLLITLRGALRDAVGKGLLARNPLAGYRLESYRSPERRPWSPAQARAFLRHAEDDRLVVLFRLALLHGLRRGECSGLRWEDLDLDAGTLAVRQQLVYMGGQAIVSPPKSAKSRRSFSLDAGTVAALRAHKATQGRERLRAGSAWRDRGLVFAREDGSPLRPYEVTLGFQRLAREAGLPVIRFHDTRHTSATIMLAVGINPKVVSERLGHATVGITLDLYGHVLLEQDQDAAARIGDVLG